MNKRWLILLICVLSLLSAKAQLPTFRLQAVKVDTICARLSWNSQEVDSYIIYRQFPSDPDRVPLSVTPDTLFIDTLQRLFCGDTVYYSVAALDNTTLSQVAVSDTQGIYFQDLYPTSPCKLRVASVDSLLQLISLSWDPSPDTDILGYYICTGMPCLDYDTVWGRLNTSYICSFESVENIHNFRVLAFDSCFRASPLTPYCRNMVLDVTADSCAHSIAFEWNSYINMPDSVASYTLWGSYNGYPYKSFVCRQQVSDETYREEITLPDTVLNYAFYVRADNRAATLYSLSNRVERRTARADSAQFIAIEQAQYQSDIIGITFQCHVDPSYPAPSYTLYRSRENESFRLLDHIPYTAEEYIVYTDTDIDPRDSVYSYFLSVLDGCGINPKYSDTVEVLLPPIPQPAAYFPNIITPNSLDGVRFCPTIVSVMPESYQLSIFNRQGLLVFSSSDPAQCWEGTSVDGRPLPQGTYVYHCRCRHGIGVTRNYVGTITLIK